MEQFLNDLSYFIMGSFLGYVWNPLWALIKKIYSEAKKAQKEW